ncbi:hypothetical protein CROQUDRAFT_274639 [Cronartium quercuum f. sp. fusiforme G11]|uniref:Uncharacterized protein n=1 Tax=Cronartium quercuum f. sp. fusiforme G11 TaxID=708437 RepID=A0A9P6NUN3_9BASI|nr:hypothetical protein CROQUDRAFT_274639 [Cronartium quercuum f. sp. fusiforme G11]
MLPDEFPGLPALSDRKTKVNHPQKQAQGESPDPNQALQDVNSYSDLTSITADEAKVKAKKYKTHKGWAWLPEAEEVPDDNFSLKAAPSERNTLHQTRSGKRYRFE